MPKIPTYQNCQLLASDASHARHAGWYFEARSIELARTCQKLDLFVKGELMENRFDINISHVVPYPVSLSASRGAHGKSKSHSHKARPKVI